MMERYKDVVPLVQEETRYQTRCEVARGHISKREAVMLCCLLLTMVSFSLLAYFKSAAAKADKQDDSESDARESAEWVLTALKYLPKIAGAATLAVSGMFIHAKLEKKMQDKQSSASLVQTV